MCKIGINIDAITPDGTTIESALGRYRLEGGGLTDWVNFTISLTNPETPNITTIGVYELEVNVSTMSKTSDWSNRVTFRVSANCNDNTSVGTTTIDMVSYLIRFDPDEIWDGQDMYNWWVVYNTDTQTGLTVRLNQMLATDLGISNLVEVTLCATSIVGWSKTGISEYVSLPTDSSVVVERTTDSCTIIGGVQR